MFFSNKKPTAPMLVSPYSSTKAPFWKRVDIPTIPAIIAKIKKVEGAKVSKGAKRIFFFWEGQQYEKSWHRKQGFHFQLLKALPVPMRPGCKQDDRYCTLRLAFDKGTSAYDVGHFTELPILVAPAEQPAAQVARFGIIPHITLSTEQDARPSLRQDGHKRQRFIPWAAPSVAGNDGEVFYHAKVRRWGIIWAPELDLDLDERIGFQYVPQAYVCPRSPWTGEWSAAELPIIKVVKGVSVTPDVAHVSPVKSVVELDSESDSDTDTDTDSEPDTDIDVDVDTSNTADAAVRALLPHIQSKAIDSIVTKMLIQYTARGRHVTDAKDVSDEELEKLLEEVDQSWFEAGTDEDEKDEKKEVVTEKEA